MTARARLSSGSAAVFFGAYSGGTVTGSGQVFLEGDTRPGFSAGLMSFGGDENHVDVAQVLASDEPRGPENAPNRRTETSGAGARN